MARKHQKEAPLKGRCCEDPGASLGLRQQEEGDSAEGGAERGKARTWAPRALEQGTVTDVQCAPRSPGRLGSAVCPALGLPQGTEPTQARPLRDHSPARGAHCKGLGRGGQNYPRKPEVLWVYRQLYQDHDCKTLTVLIVVGALGTPAAVLGWAVHGTSCLLEQREHSQGRADPPNARLPPSTGLWPRLRWAETPNNVHSEDV